MRLLFIRHGEPDYSVDSLTEKGFREAEYLCRRLENEAVDKVFVSSLTRAQDTAKPFLVQRGFVDEAWPHDRVLPSDREAYREKVQKSYLGNADGTLQICDWMREFWAGIERPDQKGQKNICWDFYPEDIAADPRYFDPDEWLSTEAMRSGPVKETAEYVTSSLDRVLAENGYIRDGFLYRAEAPNRKTLVFFGHFGNICVMLSHLLHISPMIAWHFLSIPTSSVTTLYTEERREGKAIFRAQSIGDVSHLYAAGEKPSFSCRFCETWDNMDERH